MAVKPGYKQTVAGVVPEDWECTRISDVAKLESGHTPSKREPSYWNGSIPWVSLFDTEGLQGKEIYVTAKMVTEEGINNSSARILPKGTVVFSRTATVGKTTVMGCEMATSQDFANYICGPKLHNHFLVFLFRNMGRTWKSLMAGSIHNTIYMPVFKALQIILPPLHEQRAIATALSDVDALQGALERLLAKKRDLKQATMQQLLTGQTRLPGFYRSEREAFQKTDLGFIPSDWVLRQLGDLVDQSRSIRYGIVQPGKYDQNGRYMIRGQDYSKGWVEPSELFRVSAPIEERYKNARVATGDLIITIVGAGTGHVEAIPKWLDGANLTQTTARISIEANKADSVFVKYMLRAPVGTRQVSNYMKGAAQPGLNCGDINKFVVLLPPTLPEQTAIAAVLTDMDAELTVLERRLAKTRALKQGMMQELLTGRTRLV